MANFQDASLDSDVYTGLWINQSYGKIYGATLTLSRRSGGFLIAFLALYVSISGKSFWKIVRYFLHSVFSSTRLPDGVYHQRQAILRNSKSAPDAVQEIANILLAWRKRAFRRNSRLLPVLAVAFVVAAGFATAGVFSSRVTSNDNNDVILVGSGCTTNLSAIFESQIVELMRYRRRRISEYLADALECYQGSQTGLSSRCHTYTKPNLPYTLDGNAGCPFPDKMCKQKTGNILLDTGYLDSNTDLGINAGPHFRVRSTRQCAPLVTDGYTRVYSDAQNGTEQFMAYKYGNITMYDAVGEGDGTYVYQVPIKGAPTGFQIESFFRSELGDYITSGLSSSASSRTYYTPIPDLDIPDAVLTLLFLSSNGLLYLNKTEDPWFNATKPVYLDIVLDPFGPELYMSDEPARVLGCTSRMWLCNAKLSEQAGCVNFVESLHSLPEIWSDPEDLAAMHGFVDVLTNFNGLLQPELLYNSPGLSSLLSRSTVTGPLQLDLIPPTKWQQEMEYIYQVGLVSMQSTMVEASQEGGFWGDATICPTAAACQKLCHNQRIKSSNFYSFSVLGISIIILLGLVLMITGTFIESIAAWIIRCRGRKSNRRSYAWLEWQSNSTLQLQRLAHEGGGLGRWSGATENVPVTERGDALGVLDITDPKHPRLTSLKSTKQLVDVDPKAVYEEERINQNRELLSQDQYRSTAGTPSPSNSEYESVPLRPRLDSYDRELSLQAGRGQRSSFNNLRPSDRYYRVPSQEDR